MAINTQLGLFLPTTSSFDRAVLDSLKPGSPEFKEAFIDLSQAVNDIQKVVNVKESGYYVETEFVNGSLWFKSKSVAALEAQPTQTPQYRQEYTKVVDFGPLPNTGIASQPHGITVTSDVTFTRRTGEATDTAAGAHPAVVSIPIPYASNTANNSIETWITATHVFVDVGTVNRSNFDTTYIVLKYIKQS